MMGNSVLLFSIQVTQTSIKSLELIQDLDFNAIAPWVAIEGEGAVFLLKMRKINVRDYKIIDCVRRGENT